MNAELGLIILGSVALLALMSKQHRCDCGIPDCEICFPPKRSTQPKENTMLEKIGHIFACIGSVLAMIVMGLGAVIITSPVWLSFLAIVAMGVFCFVALAAPFVMALMAIIHG